MKKFPFVSIVICTQDRAGVLKKYALNSILKLDYPNYEVVVVDDASKDKTGEAVREYQKRLKNLRLVRNNKRRGLCYVRNLGIKNSRGEIIVFTDDDCIVDKNWLKELVKIYLEDKDAMVVGGKTYFGNSRKIFNPGMRIFGCNMSFRKQVFDRFLFDTNVYFNKSSYHDEMELIYRIRKKGFKVVYAKNAIVKHFPQPAEYRKREELGGLLNELYRHAKRFGLKNYYGLFLKSRLSEENPELSEAEEKALTRFKSVKGLISDKPGKTRFYYVLLLELPVKAKIKNHIEEKRFRL